MWVCYRGAVAEEVAVEEEVPAEVGDGWCIGLLS